MNTRQIKKLEFFDCEASFGITGFKRENTPVTKEEMISKFDRYGIDYALVRYEYCSTGIARIGNIELMEELRNDSRLFPMWAALPHHTGEFPEPEELVTLMKQYDVRIITLPAGNWTVGEWTCGELFRTLANHRIPIFLPLSRISNGYAGLYEILKEHPELRVIITGVGYNCMRDIYALLKKFPNLYVCTSTYKAFAGLEDTVEMFGAERLVFGSGMPLLSGAASVALLTYADIDDEAKQMIASGNIKRLMSEVEF